MKTTRIFRLLSIVILFIALNISDLNAQFYNGHQMDFGKNRVQYNYFFWQYYRFERFDTYYDINGRELAAYVSRVADKEIADIEKYLNYRLEKRIIFVIYNKHSEFKQSNIGYVSASDDQSNIGGVTRIIDNKVFLYFEGNHESFDLQIRSAVAQLILNEMLYGGNLRDRLASSTLLNIPEWFSEGLIAYITNEWTFEAENKVKDGILSNQYKYFNRLRGKDAKFAGHSIWRFVANEFGKSTIPSIIYMTRVNRDAQQGFLFVLGYDFKMLATLWGDYYRKKYLKTEQECDFPAETERVIKPKKETVYQQAKFSPDGRYIVYTTNQMGKYRVYLYDSETGKKKKIYQRGHKLVQITDYSYPLVAWHPAGKMFSFITEEKGFKTLTNYLLETEEIIQRRLFDVEKVMDFSYSTDGLRLVMSAYNKGRSDIYVFHMTSNSFERLTNDLADDLNPRFIDNSDKIIFSSNRLGDSLITDEEDYAPRSATYDLFVLDYKNKSKLLTRISNTPYVNESHPFELSKDKFGYLSDETGIINRFEAQYDSTISFIDTTTHYRHFTNTKPISNYSRSILEHSYNANTKTFTDVFLKDKLHQIFNSTFDDNSAQKVEPPQTKFRKEKTNKFIKIDTLLAKKERKRLALIEKMRLADSLVKANPPMPSDHPDSSFVNTRQYIFEVEKQNSPYAKYFLDSLGTMKNDEKDSTELPTPIYYRTAFYTSYVVSQVDFSFLNSSYQRFTGGEVFFNPGFNVLFKVGTQDLFEDYRIVAGVRFAGNFDSNEYLVSLENLKKRWDKQYIFHRQAMSYLYDQYYENKVHSHNLLYILKYPFNQVASVRFTTNFRHDRSSIKANDYASLREKDGLKSYNHFSAGAKVEYVFDNSRSLGLNLYEGTRYKIFGEFYHRLDKSQTDLWVFGADFRHYVRIHRSLIWANRFAASTSLGNNKLIYYLGAVDNWINVTPSIETFNRGTEIDLSENYAYQTVATNMRGFSQNIRNGNSFAVFNTEIRWPMFRYFANRPLASDFLNNFQLVGFFDIGSAWTGWSPFDKESAYNRDIYGSEQGGVIVTVEKNISPLVAGYGFGIHSRILGYFVRFDWAWGIDSNVRLPRVFYVSLNLDF